MNLRLQPCAPSARADDFAKCEGYDVKNRKNTLCQTADRCTRLAQAGTPNAMTWKRLRDDFDGQSVNSTPTGTRNKKPPVASLRIA